MITTTSQEYREHPKIIKQIKEEKNEVVEAAKEYKVTPRTGTLIHLKMEFGDLLYAICCLANSYHKVGIKKPQRKIPLDEVFDAAPKEDLPYDKRRKKLDTSVDALAKAVLTHPENVEAIKTRIGALLFAIYSFVPVCCENDPENIDLDHGFAMTLNKNKKRAKEGYTKENK